MQTCPFPCGKLIKRNARQTTRWRESCGESERHGGRSRVSSPCRRFAGGKRPLAKPSTTYWTQNSGTPPSACSFDSPPPARGRVSCSGHRCRRRTSPASRPSSPLGEAGRHVTSRRSASADLPDWPIGPTEHCRASRHSWYSSYITVDRSPLSSTRRVRSPCRLSASSPSVARSRVRPFRGVGIAPVLASASPGLVVRVVVMSGEHKIKYPSEYVKLNIGGSLHYTTIGTLQKHDTMLRAMFSGRMEVLTDSEGKGLSSPSGRRDARKWTLRRLVRSFGVHFLTPLRLDQKSINSKHRSPIDRLLNVDGDPFD